MQYEEKQLYELLKTVKDKRYLTQKAIVTKYGEDTFSFLTYNDYIYANNLVYAPRLKNNGMFETHDTDRYYLTTKGVGEYNRLEYIYHSHWEEKFWKYGPMIISLVALIKSFMN